MPFMHLQGAQIMYIHPASAAISFLVGTFALYKGSATVFSQQNIILFTLFLLFQRYISGPLNNYLLAKRRDIRVDSQQYILNIASLLLIEICTLIGFSLTGAVAGSMENIFLHHTVPLETSIYTHNILLLALITLYTVWAYISQWYLLVAPYSKDVFHGLALSRSIQKRLTWQTILIVIAIGIGYNILQRLIEAPVNTILAPIYMLAWLIYSAIVTNYRRHIVEKSVVLQTPQSPLV